ncbi:hypothetical protein B0T37_10690 [Chromobacterium violaceum]|uniref:hypothetical protein n=1 Tax=Chromobacterium violaceum TaxID=536 RepID=UPI0009DAA8A5|nr:hypothetical protein [Chromobacterium violaceum]OQS10105.1 hypothetical protein B0T38_11085 [Chromobacterium violaceum]OQS26520.1 hypothetical protein B0T37_10690 [Chromobacterium violaceum]
MSWIKYSEHRPATAGEYLWRMPSKVCDGMFVIAKRKFRWRGAGYENVLSPDFDDWDGYRVSVPADVEWMDVPPELAAAKEVVIPEGVALVPCPFCGKTPHFHAMRYSGGGFSIRPSPDILNTWWTECCEWAGKVRYNDPRKLAAARSALLGKEPA